MKVRLGKGASVIVQHREWYPGETRDIHPGVFEGLQKKYPGRFVEVVSPSQGMQSLSPRPLPPTMGGFAVGEGEELTATGVPPGEQVDGQGLPPAVEVAAEVSPSEGEGDREVKNVEDVSGAGKPAGKRSGGSRRSAKR